MSDLNLSIIEGRVIKKPEIKHTLNGKIFCLLPIASNTFYKVDNQWQKETTFINVKCWNILAENVASRLEKGEEVVVYGKLKYNSFTTANNKRKTYHYILASKIDRYGKKSNKQNNRQIDIENSKVVSISEEVPA